jgi:DNA modification methylase
LSAPVNKLFNCDCITGIQKLDTGSVDLAFADPPFNIGYDYDVYHDKLESERYLAWCRDWIGEVVRVLKTNGTFWLAIGDEYAAELKVMMQRDRQPPLEPGPWGAAPGVCRLPQATRRVGCSCARSSR